MIDLSCLTTTKIIYDVTIYGVAFINNDTIELKIYKGDTSYKKSSIRVVR